jgi:hypothetical protein
MASPGATAGRGQVTGHPEPSNGDGKKTTCGRVSRYSLRERQSRLKGLRVTRQDPPVRAAPGAPRARKRASGGDKGRWTDGSPAPYALVDARPRSRSARGMAAPPPPCSQACCAGDIRRVSLGIARHHRGEQAVADNAARQLTRSTILDTSASCPNLAFGKKAKEAK